MKDNTTNIMAQEQHIKQHAEQHRREELRQLIIKQQYQVQHFKHNMLIAFKVDIEVQYIDNLCKSNQRMEDTQQQQHEDVYRPPGETAASMVRVIYLKRFTSSKQRELTPYQRISHVHPRIILLKVVDDFIILILILITSNAPIIFHLFLNSLVFLASSPVTGTFVDWLISLTFIIRFSSIKSIFACQLPK